MATTLLVAPIVCLQPHELASVKLLSTTPRMLQSRMSLLKASSNARCAASGCSRALPRPAPLLSLGRSTRFFSDRFIVRASEGETHDGTSSSTPSSSTPPADAPRIQRTVQTLDALLGLQEEAKPSTSSASSSTATATTNTATSTPVDISVAPDVLKKLAEAEASRVAGGDASKAGPLQDGIESQMAKIINKARKLADEQAKKTGGTEAVEAEQQELRQEVG